MAETRIRDALNIMREHGWHHPGVGYCPEQACMHTSITMAWNYLGSDGYLLDLEAVETVCREQFPGIPRASGFPTVNIWAVNDADNRTFEEIEQIMEKAAITRAESL